MHWTLGIAAALAALGANPALHMPAVPIQKEAPAIKSRQFVVTVGQTVRIQMTSKKPIAKVFNEKPAIVRVSPVADDPTTIQVTGLMPGIVRISLIDKDGNEEMHEAGPPLK